MRSKLSTTARFSLALAFFVLSLAVYNLNGRCIPVHDTLPARLLPVALLTTGSLSLDLFGTSMSHPGVDYFYTHALDGRLVSIYPVVVPLLATPFFIPSAAYFRRGADPVHFAALLDLTEKVAASFIAATSVALMWLVLSRWTTLPTAVVLTLAYAFGTETWMIGSQALWQHGMAELLLAALLLALGSRSMPAAAAAGAVSALLIINRPPDLIFAAATAFFFAWTARRAFAAFVLAALPILAVWIRYNLHTFGVPLGGYGRFVSPSLFTIDALASGILGLLVSPGRGLLVFAPFFAFLAGLRPRMAASLPPVLPFFLVMVALLIVLYGSYWDWTGGECFGPRFLTDITPILVLALAPVVDGLRRRSAHLLFAATVLIAITVQSIGAFCYQMGGSGTPRNQWSLANVQYLIELRAGPAPPSFGRWREAARAAISDLPARGS